MSGSEKSAEGTSKLTKDSNPSDLITFAAFLESVPPPVECEISDLCTPISVRGGSAVGLSNPEIQLHCPSKKCSGMRFFSCQRPVREMGWRGTRDIFLNYVCRNCGDCFKTFSLRVVRKDEGSESGSAVKFGEIPPFGPPLPPRLIKLVGQERELFLKGWRAENQGMGIGSFVYYRRVVEQQKDYILEEIRKAAERLGSNNELLSSIDRAKNETRFTDAIEAVKDAIPEGLKVKGHNPLKLLHRALSKGVHNLSDRQCLDQAQVIRIILNELVSNIARVTRDEREIDHALSKLL